MKHYDYIFTGAGLSALMVVHRMLESGGFADKKILLIDENAKKTNDRTWCYWEEFEGEFENIISASWKSAVFTGTDFSRSLDFTPYKYKMIHGIDFYNYIFAEITAAANIDFHMEKVIHFAQTETNCVVKTTKHDYSCNTIFNSIYNPLLPLSQKKYPVLQQHFIGWFIKTETPCFNPGQATFMDFSVAQRGNTRFMYILPFSTTEALLEYTLFSADLLPDSEYESAISDYIKQLGITDFTVTSKERGSIPMTAYKFWQNNSRQILHIGSAGGWTKASTGFTFRNSLKKSAALLNFLQTDKELSKFHTPTRFWLYDLLLLDILSDHNEKGAEIFSSLFKKSRPDLVLKFLNEDTSLAEDIKVIWRCPKLLFLRALVYRLFK